MLEGLSSAQDEELDVLNSIFVFEGEMEVRQPSPPNVAELVFRIADPQCELSVDALAKLTTGRNDFMKTGVFFMHVVWGPEYPDVVAEFSLDDERNGKLRTFRAKDAILRFLEDEATQQVGQQMTFYVVQALKDSAYDCLGLKDEINNFNKSLWEESDQPTCEAPPPNALRDVEQDEEDGEEGPEHLSKAQKRRWWKNRGEGGALKRGYNWVDIIRHLSKGPQVKPEVF